MKLPKFKGFTIIEVIIVLVIGAVIMIAVFVVVPQLQRTQRNTNRQNAARRVKAAVEEIYSKTGADPITQGATPTCSGTLSTSSNCKIITDITGNVRVAVGGGVYSVVRSFSSTTSPINNVNSMYINDATTTNDGCSNGKLVNTGAVSGKFAIAVAQETNVSPTRDSYCISTP